MFFAPPLNRMAIEDVVLIARRRSHALQAADEEQRHSQRNQEGDGVFIGHKPLHQAVHRHSPTTTSSRNTAVVWTRLLTYFDAFFGSGFRIVKNIIDDFLVFPLAFRGIKGEYNPIWQPLPIRLPNLRSGRNSDSRRRPALPNRRIPARTTASGSTGSLSI